MDYREPHYLPDLDRKQASHTTFNYTRNYKLQIYEEICLHILNRY